MTSATATAVRERQILFSGPMVNAILSGAKTMTRRIVKGAWHEEVGYLQSEPGGDDVEWYFSCRKVPASFVTRCPYGAPGDLLWVRETFARDDDGRVFYRADVDHDGSVPYEVSGASGFGGGVGNATITKWTPSIFMPRKFSRITLEITAVRVERIQSITAADAIAEGIPLKGHQCGCEFCSHSVQLCPATQSSLIMAYVELWDSLNAKTHPWSSNCWVWVIEFRKVKP